MRFCWQDVYKRQAPESSEAEAPESSEASSEESEAPADTGNMPTVEKIKEKGELVMLTNAAFPPVSYTHLN